MVSGRRGFYFFLFEEKRAATHPLSLSLSFSLSLSLSRPPLKTLSHHQWVYFDGYAKGGPKGRIPGAAVSNLVQLISTIVVLVVGVKAAVKLLPL